MNRSHLPIRNGIMIAAMGLLTLSSIPSVYAASGPPVVTTDSGSASFTAGDNTTSTPVVIDSGLTVTDEYATTLASATIAITGTFHSGEDVLSFTNTSSTTYGNISASYNSTTGVLTMTSAGETATLAQWQAALEAVTYTDTAVTPNNATRTVSFTVVDSADTTSNTATRTVTVADTDQTPIVTTTGGSTNYVSGTSAVTIDSGITVSDLDNSTLASATVTISSGFHSGDTLEFVNTGNIVGSYYPATGVLTMTASGGASLAQWQSALQSLSFSTSSSVSGTRTIDVTVNDGTENSALATKSVIVETVPGAPTIGTAVAGNSQATVNFTPPANDGGSPITGYTVTATASSGSATATGTSSPITVTGLTNGTPYTFTVTATNSVGTSGASASSNSVTPVAAPTVTGVSPSSGPVTGGTTVTLTGTGFTGATAVKFRSTPASSFTVNSNTSITATAPAGTTGATDVTVTTPGGTSATNANDQFTYVAVGGGGPVPPFINTVSFMEDAKVGTPYSAQLVTSGGTQPFQWSIASGSLPNGLTLNAQGQVTGTPTGLGGQYTFTVKVTDANNLTATRQLTLTVEGPTSSPSITTRSLTPYVVGQPYDQTLDVTGGTAPYTWSVTQGTLPSGLTLDAQTGAITGTTTASGVSTITVQSKDANGMIATQTLQFDVIKPDEREIVWNGQVQNVPAIVGNDDGTQTTYMPIWYVMQFLKSIGIESTWNGHEWNMTTSTTPDLSNIQSGRGSTSVYLNGTLVQQVNTEAHVDPSTNKPTTYLPIWYVQQILNRVGLQSTWDGTTWTVTQTNS